MKRLPFIVCILILGLSRCQSPDAGLAIYEVNGPYGQYDSTSVGNCFCCLDITMEDVRDEPLLREIDIDSFDYKQQQFFLSETGKQKVKDLEIPTLGIPMALVLHEEIVYGFWFWNIHSS
ncbi:MAG: hypothetical protein AAF598_04120 [Bacteroidota bacterium]